jgi:hypothetical protein
MTARARSDDFLRHASCIVYNYCTDDAKGDVSVGLEAVSNATAFGFHCRSPNTTRRSNRARPSLPAGIGFKTKKSAPAFRKAVSTVFCGA